MEVDIKGIGPLASPKIHQYAERQVLLELAKYGDRVLEVKVRLNERDRSAPTRTHCGIAVRLETKDRGEPGWALARADHDDVYDAIDRALERAGLAVGSQLMADCVQPRRASN
jgi:ribosome-associated translation inhibitor RaiA